MGPCRRSEPGVPGGTQLGPSCPHPAGLQLCFRAVSDADVGLEPVRLALRSLSVTFSTSDSASQASGSSMVNVDRRATGVSPHGGHGEG